MYFILNNKITTTDHTVEINTYVQYINKYYDILEFNIDKCDNKISKYNKKIINYESKINDIKNKLNHIIIKKNEYSGEIQLLEDIPTLQLSIINTYTSASIDNGKVSDICDNSETESTTSNIALLPPSVNPIDTNNEDNKEDTNNINDNKDNIIA